MRQTLNNTIPSGPVPNGYTGIGPDAVRLTKKLMAAHL